MKKLTVLLLVVSMLVAFAACAETTDTSSDVSSVASSEASSEAVSEAVSEEASSETSSEAEVKVMSYEEYLAAEIGSEVVVETYIQAKQGWWEKEGVGGVGTFYTQNEEGAYFIYDMPCSQEDYNDKLVAGAKIRVTGAKAQFNGEVEIIDATYEVLEGTWTATALDVTEKLGDEKIAEDMNKFAAFKGLTVVASNDDGAAFLYKWDGSGNEGDDIYFKASVGETTVSFVIESYLTGKDTDVYKAAQALKVGDVIDMEGYLYWYEGVQPHIVSITVAE